MHCTGGRGSGVGCSCGTLTRANRCRGGRPRAPAPARRLCWAWPQRSSAAGVLRAQLTAAERGGWSEATVVGSWSGVLPGLWSPAGSVWCGQGGMIRA